MTRGGIVMNDQKGRAAAIGRIKAKREFVLHAMTYVVVNIALVIVWALASAGYFWPGWVIAGWGIGLASHAVNVYVLPRPISEESIRDEMRNQPRH